VIRFLKITAIYMLLLQVAIAQSNIVVEITRGLDNPTRIAVVPFSWNGPYRLPEDVAQVVSDDLRRTGEFETVQRDNMLSMPALRSEVHLGDWRAIRSQYLVIGSMKAEGNNVALTYSLIDVTTGRTMKQGVIRNQRTQLRDLGHELSDEVYEMLTGYPGIFRTKIAYIRAERNRSDELVYRLVVADQDGYRERTIMRSKDPIMSPSWSPDGTQLAFVSFTGKRPAIYRQNLKTGQTEKLTNFKGINGAPVWSPDGKRLAMVLSKDGDSEIYVMNIASKTFERITHHYSIDTEPAWLPNENALIFTSDRGGRPHIYKVSLDTGRVQRQTFQGIYNARGRVSKDGKYLVMVHRDKGQKFSIAAQDLKSGRVHVLTETKLDESPTIAPNGRVVMYATRDGDKGILSAVAIDGGVRVKLPAAVGDIREPAWSPVLIN